MRAAAKLRKDKKRQASFSKREKTRRKCLILPMKHSELAGLGKEIWEGIDAQEYVDQLRSPARH
jgi:hypothetical protein